MRTPPSPESPGDPQPQQKARVEWVEYAKGIGILLVVLGHTLRGLADTRAAVPGSGLADAWIYAFHMPLFFYLSGLFLEGSCSRVGVPGGLGRFLVSKARRILWPYLVWSVLQEAFRSLAGVSENPLSDLWRILFQPVMQFWFLYVLFVIVAWYAAWRWRGLMPGGFVVLVFVIHFAVQFGMPLGSWGIPYQVAIYAPYVALGVLASKFGDLPDPAGRSSTALLAISFAGYAFVLVAALAGWGGGKGVILPLALTGVIASVALSELLSRLPGTGWLGVLGRYSLEIFVAHTIFSAAVRQGLLMAGISSPWIHLAGGLIAGLAGPMVLVGFCRNVGLPGLFEWPGRRRAKFS